jgi:hypothetical protein
MFMMAPSRLFASALVAAGLGFALPANAITISIDGTSATIACTSAAASPECYGFTGGGSDGFPTGPGTLSATDADPYAVLPANEGNQTDALNILASTSFLASEAIRTDTGGVDTFSFDTLATYFLLKLGNTSFFFQNNSGFVTLHVAFDKMGESGLGISHITEWGVIPLPAALPMFLAALGGLFWVGRRRRREVASAA